MYDDLLDVFYNYIIKEAAVGVINCYFRCNLKFNTRIVEEDKYISYRDFVDEALVPTLVIKNKSEFNSLLLKYVEVALPFYGDDYFPESIIDNDYRYSDKGISKEKVIMSLVWSNATYDDFNDPCNFLRKRIDFFRLGSLDFYKEEQRIGYSEIFNSDISIKICKNGLENETPYSLMINLNDVSTGDKIYEFPRIYFGISDDVGYVYAIQNSKRRFVSEKWQKKIDRLMYKINEGLDVNEDNSINYGEGNLKDVTPNMVVGANILMGLFKNIGISKVVVPPILITRWNEKMIRLEREKMILFNKTLEDIENDYNDILRIQSNLSEKFLRVFRRIGYHHSSVMISSYPFEEGNNLEIKLLDYVDICNNKLLDETFNMDVSKVKGISK